MKLAEATDVWFLTQGMNKGIAAEIGRARMRYSSYAPAIGIISHNGKRVPAGHQESMLQGLDSITNFFCEQKQKRGSKPHPYFTESQKLGSKAHPYSTESQQHDVTKPAPLLEENHSHFFLLQGQEQDEDWGMNIMRAFESKLATLLEPGEDEEEQDDSDTQNATNTELNTVQSDGDRSVHGRRRMNEELAKSVRNYKEWMRDRHPAGKDPVPPKNSTLFWWEREPGSNTPTSNASGAGSLRRSRSSLRSAMSVEGTSEQAQRREEEQRDGVPVVIICFQVCKSCVPRKPRRPFITFRCSSFRCISLSHSSLACANGYGLRGQRLRQASELVQSTLVSKTQRCDHHAKLKVSSL